MDFAISMWEGEFLFIQFNPFRMYSTLSIHESQFAWYRRLFILFSRYSYFNSYGKPIYVQLKN